MTSPAEPAVDSRLFAAAEEVLARFLELEASDAARPPLSAADASSLPLELPRVGLGEGAALARLKRVIEATPPTAGPRFVNQLFAGRESVATIAEIAASVLNTSMYTYKAAGPQVLIERAVIERLLDIARMRGGDGMFTPGGSLSNLAAMIVGRNEVVPGAREDGFDGRTRTLYVSSESHYSVRKNANMIGIGRGNVRAVAVDAQGRMRPEALSAMIASDRAAGLDPMMVVATCGTTVMGSFDPLSALAAIAAREGMWLHADGAFGGTALLHPSSSSLLDGLESCDSFTWDAHKAMGVPLTCSVALTRRPGLMQKHFDESASYLFQRDHGAEEAWLNPGRRSLQCGRRNDALKLWAQWQAIGDDGYAARVGRQRELARLAAEFARAHPAMRLTHEPAWLTVCFEIIGKPSDLVCEELDRTGELKIGFGVVHGRRVLRLVTVNPEHTRAQIERMMEEILAAAARVPDGDNAVGPQSSPDPE